MSKDPLLEGGREGEKKIKLSRTEFFEAQLIVEMNMPLKDKPLIDLFPNILKTYEALITVWMFLTCRGKKGCCKKKKMEENEN